MALAWRLRLLYFLYYGATGTLLPYLAPYLRGLGFSGTEIGAVQMLGPLLAPAAALLWAALADRTGRPDRALRLATGLSAVAALGLPWARTPLAVAAVVLLQAAGDRAVVPLLDSLTLEHVRGRPGATYARIRLGGSLGFALLALGTGALLAWRGDRPADPLLPWLVVALLAGLAAAAQGLRPDGPVHPARPGWGDLRALLGSRPLRLLLGACAVHWLACAPYHLFFGVLVRDRGLPALVTGLGMGAGVAAEVLALLVFPALASRFSLRALFGAAFAASALRWALLWQASGAAAVIALQLLHGFTFGLFWGAAMAGMARLVPAPLRTTGQALFSAIVFGVGNGVGYALSGWLYDRAGAAAPLFGWSSVIEIALLIVVVVNRLGPDPAAIPERNA